MGRAAVVTRILVRACGLVLVALGVLFWLGIAKTLVPLHMLVGLVLVLCLWTIAVLALRARVGAGPAAGAIAWGFVTVALGVTQTRIMPGSLHWIVQVVHLAVGMVAVGMADGLTRRILAHPSTVATA